MERISVGFNDKTWEVLKRTAKDESRPISNLIRLIVEKHFKKVKDEANAAVEKQ